MSELNNDEVKGNQNETIAKQQKQLIEQKPSIKVSTGTQQVSQQKEQIPQSNELQKKQISQVQNQSIQKPLTSLLQPQVQPNTFQLTQQKLQIKAELQSMQFQPGLIQEALRHVSTLDEAIEFIINQIQSVQKDQLGLSKEVKLFFIVRMDLKMGTGKIAAQVGHAALRAFQNMRYSSSNNDNSANLLIQWMQNGQKSKILQAQTENDLHRYLDKAGNKFINNCYIRDAGRTQIAAGSMTVAAIGPVRQCDADFLQNLEQL